MKTISNKQYSVKLQITDAKGNIISNIDHDLDIKAGKISDIEGAVSKFKTSTLKEIEKDVLVNEQKESVLKKRLSNAKRNKSFED